MGWTELEISLAAVIVLLVLDVWLRWRTHIAWQESKARIKAMFEAAEADRRRDESRANPPKGGSSTAPPRSQR